MRRHTNPTIDRLAAIPLFVGCTRSELALVSRNLTEHHIARGGVLMREAHVGRDFVVIVEGTAVVLVGGRTVGRLGPGDFAGEIALLDKGLRTATVVAETDLVTMVCGPPEFTMLLVGAPSVARRLLVSLAARLRDADLRAAS